MSDPLDMQDTTTFDGDSVQTEKPLLGLVGHEPLRPEEGDRDLGRIFTMLLFALLVVAMLLSIIVGTTVYRSLSSIQTTSEDTRLSLGLIENSVRSSDATDSVGVGQGPEGRSLVLIEHLTSGTYETRIYLYQGEIVEEYAISGAAYTPAKATRIASSQTFSFTYKGGLLAITTDHGTVDVALRNVQGGA